MVRRPVGARRMRRGCSDYRQFHFAAGGSGGLERSVSPRWAEKALSSFDYTDGAYNTYAGWSRRCRRIHGTTQFGGYSICDSDESCGVVFELVRGADGKWNRNVVRYSANAIRSAFGRAPAWSPTPQETCMVRPTAVARDATAPAPVPSSSCRRATVLGRRRFCTNS